MGVIIATTLLFFSKVDAQTNDNLIYLHHADSLIGMEIDGERARQLIGNVKFTHGKTTVTCRKAMQYLQSNKATLDGEVVVTEDSMTMVAEHGVYYGKTRVAEAQGRVRLDDGAMTLYADQGTYYSETKIAHFKENVKVYDTSSVLTSDEMTYYRDEQRTVAEGNVTITGSENNMVIAGGHFENYRKRKFSRMVEQPRATSVDTTDGVTDSLVIVADTMETYQDTLQRLVAIGNVVMNRSDITAEAGSGIFYTKLDSIQLRRSPFVWYTQTNGTTTQASGDSMFIKLEKRQLKTQYVQGHAFAISEADLTLPKRLHQLSGQDITMFFNLKKLDRIEVDRTATILYFLFDDKTPNGFNNTTGDHVTISFLDGRIDQLKVVGGIEGKYAPERLVAGKEEEYNLTGFNWKLKTTIKR
ncbi:MAG: LPS export ABC transporter periplasmic protein LptC [Ignavibacteriales bacterium]|nr:LPS export ABC transporter periplasmic protein LptC [Ignavibacteriales bacterium]